MKSVRIATHVHSAWSYDAEWPLQRIERMFRRLGYDAVLMAEHERGFDQHRWSEYQHACREASTPDLLIVPGIEYEDPDNVVHVPVWGTEVTFLGTTRTTMEILEAAREQEAVAVFAHPMRRSAIQRFDPRWAPLLSGVELWNRKADGIAPSNASRRLADGHGLASFVSLDFHDPRQLFPLAMIASLDRPLTAASIIRAVRQGTCRPQFLGVSALSFTDGAQGGAVMALEHLRRRLRGPLRRIAKRLA
jgi:hypothetical protein